MSGIIGHYTDVMFRQLTRLIFLQNHDLNPLKITNFRSENIS